MPRYRDPDADYYAELGDDYDPSIDHDKLTNEEAEEVEARQDRKELDEYWRCTRGVK